MPNDVLADYTSFRSLYSELVYNAFYLKKNIQEDISDYFQYTHLFPSCRSNF